MKIWMISLILALGFGLSDPRLYSSPVAGQDLKKQSPTKKQATTHAKKTPATKAETVAQLKAKLLEDENKNQNTTDQKNKNQNKKANPKNGKTQKTKQGKATPPNGSTSFGEGFYILGKRGRIVLAKDQISLVFAFEDESKPYLKRGMYLLPCQALQRMQVILAKDPDHVFELSGEVFIYRNEVYLIPMEVK